MCKACLVFILLSSVVAIAENKTDAPSNMTATVAKGEAVPSITSPSFIKLAYGREFEYRILASNDPIAYGVTGLPAWASLEGAFLSGSANKEGEFVVEIRATNMNGTSEAFRLKLIVTKPSPIIAEGSPSENPS